SSRRRFFNPVLLRKIVIGLTHPRPLFKKERGINKISYTLILRHKVLFGKSYNANFALSFIRVYQQRALYPRQSAVA
ncbi:hypothetical protein KJ665_00005, partial [Patescibacteria group bacterium]|nr:hypothetical protein [Patescibacteria group bacterium]